MFGLDTLGRIVLGRCHARRSSPWSRSCSASATPTDPDHLAAVTTLIAGTASAPRRARRPARPLLGPRPRDDPVRLRRADRALPERTCPRPCKRPPRRPSASLIVGSRASGCSSAGTAAPSTRTTTRPRRARSPLQAYGIGLVHGMGGSAGVGVLLLASIHDREIAVAALGLFALCTALSMAAALDRASASRSSAARVGRVFPRSHRCSGVLSLVLRRLVRAGRPSGRPILFLDGDRSACRCRGLRHGRARRRRGARVRGAPRRRARLPRGAREPARDDRGPRLRRAVGRPRRPS